MNIWQEIYPKLDAGQKVYLLTVIKNAGSSPGRKGFKMMVSEDGHIAGSIGGGMMEFLLIEEAKEALKLETLPCYHKDQIHRINSEQGSGMICSGEQTVSFQPFYPSDITTIGLIIESLKSDVGGKFVLFEDSFSFLQKKGNNEEANKVIDNQKIIYQENIHQKPTLYIVGGGHVSLAVSKLFHDLDFKIKVFDNRHDINTLENNEYASEKNIIDYKDIRNYISDSQQHYVVIMTNKFTEDQLVVQQLIGGSYAYMGVLGSKAKIKILWNNLKKLGVDKEKLAAVHSPIGYQIKSQTPMEIAVSIAAEIIKIKNVNK